MTSVTRRKPHLVVFSVLALSLVLLAGCGSENKLAKGSRAPAFIARDLNGNEVDLSHYQGHPVVLRFFLTDCKFCEADTPYFIDFYEQNKDKGLRMVYINSSARDLAEVEAFSQRLAVPFPVVYDAEEGHIST